MISYRQVLAAASCVALLWIVVPNAAQIVSPATSRLMGIVKSPDGTPMEGVAVSTKREGSTITTSVWTDRNGVYSFPPLENGDYRVWAQAVGFDMNRARRLIASGAKVQQDFALQPAEYFGNQLSGAEWLESLPANTPEDRRMKKVVFNSCVVCHQIGLVLEKRFSAADWELLVEQMGKMIRATDPEARPGGGEYGPPEFDRNGRPKRAASLLFDFYQPEIAAYLARVRGPLSYPTLKPFPRATGDATRIVVTEYDLPMGTEEGASLGKLDPTTGRNTRYTLTKDGRTLREEVTDPREYRSEYHSGADWSLGPRIYDGVAHDIVLGTDGNIYYAGRAGGDPRGGIWFGALTRLDFQTQQLRAYPKPPHIGALTNGRATDSTGFGWTTQMNGLARINRQTGEWTEFKSLTPHGRPYDIAIDRLDQVWFAQIGIDKIGVVNARTGETREVVLPAREMAEILPKDIEIAKRAGGGWNMITPLNGQGPRKMGAEHADFLWVGMYWGGGLAKIDIRTKKFVRIYPIPGPGGQWVNPYDVVVDKNNMVWFGMSNADMLGKFNPVTEQFTFYPLSARGIDARHLAVDNSTNPPTVWVPYMGSDKVARVQFR